MAGDRSCMLLLQISLFEFLTLLFILLLLAIEYLWWQCFATTFSSIIHSSSQSHHPFSNKSCLFGCCWHDCIMLWSVVSSLFLKLKVIKLLRNLILLEEFLGWYGCLKLLLLCCILHYNIMHYWVCHRRSEVSGVLLLAPCMPIYVSS